jgi:hypothetical protein
MRNCGTQRSGERKESRLLEGQPAWIAKQMLSGFARGLLGQRRKLLKRGLLVCGETSAQEA